MAASDVAQLPRQVREFTVRLPVNDPISFMADADTNIVKSLRAIYEKRCYMACFVDKIVRVVERGPCYVSVIVESNIDVKFEAEVAYLQRDEIIPVRVSVSKPLVAGEWGGDSESPPSFVTFRLPPNITVTTGQTVPVRIVDVEYPPMKDHVSATAQLVNGGGRAASSYSPRAYSISGRAPGPQAAATIEMIVAAIRREMAERQTLMETMPTAAIVGMFDAMMVRGRRDADLATVEIATKTCGTWKGPKGKNVSRTRSLLDSVEDGDWGSLTGIWYKARGLSLSSPEFVFTGDDAPIDAETENALVAPGTGASVIAMLGDILCHLRGVRRLTAAFPTEKAAVLAFKSST